MRFNKNQVFFFRAVSAFLSVVAIFFAIAACSANTHGPSDDPASNSDLKAFVKQSECHASRVSEQLVDGKTLSGKGLANIDNYCRDLSEHFSVLNQQHDAIKRLGSSTEQGADNPATDAELVFLVKRSACQESKVTEQLSLGQVIKKSDISKIEHLCTDAKAQAIVLKNQREAINHL